MQDEFTRFLKLHGSWERFILNLDQEPEVFFKKAEPVEYLAGAFVWSATPEGGYYWEVRNGLWLRRVDRATVA